MQNETNSIKGLKALIVDDERDNLIVSRAILDYFGASVRSAESGAEALQIAADWQPMIILLDLVMPDRNGLDVLHDLRKIPHIASVPVIACTADESAIGGGVERLYEQGFDGHIFKPFVIQDMVSAILRCLDNHPPDGSSAA